MPAGSRTTQLHRWDGGGKGTRKVEFMLQMRWAIGASCCAVAVEAPLDHAKRAMMGSTRLLVGANLLFVPFAAMMLVMYDKAASRAVRTVLHPQL